MPRKCHDKSAMGDLALRPVCISQVEEHIFVAFQACWKFAPKMTSAGKLAERAVVVQTF